MKGNFLNIRSSAFAGSFYPAQSKNLLQLTTQLLDENKQTPGNAKAIIVPHAGYVFSGGVAASAFNLLRETNDAIIFVIGSSHHSLFQGAALETHDAYQTPLGNIAVNTEITKTLAQNNNLFSLLSEPHEKEHALEVQIPFLQTIFPPSTTVVPILLGNASTIEIKQMSDILFPYFERTDTRFVISTDLSHYPPFDIAEETDHRVITSVCSGDPDNLKETLQHEASRHLPGYRTGMCGYKAVLLLQYITKKFPWVEYRLIKYQNSGHSQFGCNDGVVGYAAISITLKKRQHERPDANHNMA